MGIRMLIYDGALTVKLSEIPILEKSTKIDMQNSSLGKMHIHALPNGRAYTLDTVARSLDACVAALTHVLPHGPTIIGPSGFAPGACGSELPNDC